MIYVRLLLFWLGIAALGGAVVAAVRPRPLGRLHFLGLSYVLGYGVLGVLSILIMAFGGRIGLVAGLLLLAAAATVLVFRRVTFAPPEPVTRSAAWIFLGLALAVGLGLAIFRVGQGWDADSSWSLKAWSLARYGTYRNPDFMEPVRPLVLPRYPLLTPVVHGWVHLATGSTADAPIRLTMFVFFLASLAVLAAAIRERAPRGAADWLLAAYALTPAVLTADSGGAGGICDYPLAILILVACLEGKRWIETGERGAAVLSAVSLACVAQLKVEALSLVGGAAVLFPLFYALKRGGRDAWRPALLALPGLALIGLWTWAKQPIREGESAIPITASLHVSRLPEVLRALGSYMIRYKEYSLLWPAILLAIALRPPRPRESDSLLLWLAGLQFLAYVVVYLMPPLEIEPRVYMSHNVKRLLLHLLPLSYVWFSGRFGDWWARSRPAPSKG